MRALKQILTALLMAVVLSLTVMTTAPVQAQKNDNRPPKETPKIKEKEKPPPSNSNNSNRKKP